jgi:prolyl-tRNA synthetase
MAQEKSSSEEMGITIKKDEDSAEWYAQVCQKAELADYAPVKGCMVIRPKGYFIWQAIQRYFDENINKKHNVLNGYFPLFIPESFFKKEAEHAQGFTPEVAWLDKEVTGEGERLAVRPTSETIMYDSYSKWIRSHRDLPLKINQWCNVVRWETEATKLFLRSREFLWQEGHCVYETKEECDNETLSILDDYAELCRKILAVPVLKGYKTEKEKFAGAHCTTTVESLMPDGKALQCGTSHNLGQGFAKSFGIEFIGKDEQKHLPWQNSWGISTRLIGAVVLTHSDDKGLVIPPAIAMNKIAIIPILFDKTKEKVLKKCHELKKKLVKYSPILDDRDAFNPGYKFNEWEMKGVPLRIEIGPKDIESRQVVMVRRDTGKKEFVKETKIPDKIKEIFEQMPNDMYEKALSRMNENTASPKTFDDLKKAIDSKKWAKTQWCGEHECEDAIKDETGAGIRCIPLNSKPSGRCIYCGKEAKHAVYIARSY